MKRIFSLILALVCLTSFYAFTVNAEVVSDGAGWTLDFSSEADGSSFPFTLTNASATVSGGALKVDATAKGPRLVYNGSFSVNADEIEKIVIVVRGADGEYFQPYLYFGGSKFDSTNVFRSKAIRGTGDWQTIEIDTRAKKIYMGSTNCTADNMSADLNWSGTITAFRLDSTNQTTDFELKSISFVKAPVDGVSTGKGWEIDFSAAQAGASHPFTLTSAAAQVADGYLDVTTTAKGPRLVYGGKTFGVKAEDIEKIVITARAASGKYFQPYLYFGGSFKGTNVFIGKAIPGTGEWQEIVINTKDKTIYMGSTNCTGSMPSELNWSGDITAFRLDNANQTADFDIKSIRFLPAPVNGVSDGKCWTLDFSNAADGDLPGVNAHGDDKINTNATYSISGGAMQVTPLASDVTTPRIAISNRSNFSVNPADITKIYFRLKSEATIKGAKLYFATASGSFSAYATAVVNPADADGWQDVVFFPQGVDSWKNGTNPITKFRFDLTLSESKVVDVKHIKFTDDPINKYTVKFEGKEPVVYDEGTVLSEPTTDITKENHTYFGWGLKGTSTIVKFPYTVVKDAEFVTLWGPNSIVEQGIAHPVRWIAEKESPKDYAYSFCVVGDTQNLTDKAPDKLSYIYDWIVENKEEKDIEFVIGLGDITNYSRVDEWEVAKEQISKLNGVVPYSLVRGSENHDQSAMFNEYFNTPAYTDTLEGFYDETMINNTWRTFSVGGVDYLFLMLDFGPSDDVIEWAGQVIEQHPYHRVIISTHCYLYSDGTTVDYQDEAPPHKTEIGDGTKNNGDEMWDKLISRYENIFLVLCGHIDSSKIVVAKQEGIHGNTVTSMLVDPQGVDGGITPSGLVAMLYFSEDGESIEVEYYSTVLDMYYMTENQFTIDIDKYEGNPENQTSAVLGYADGKADVRVKSAGTYTVIFADYENGELSNVELKEVTLSTGTSTVTRDETFALGNGDLIMVWNNMEDITPVCASYIIE